MRPSRRAVWLPTALRAGVGEAGVDEAGRGCLAGPVVAAAVILPTGWRHPWLNDSKQLTPRRRLQLRAVIEAEAEAWATGWCSPAEIDAMNILQASIEAMHRALSALPRRPGHIAVDGNRFLPFDQVPHTTVVRGDALLADIAAASVLAKTERDAYMLRQAQLYPHYHWERNMGYPTADHRAALAQWGPTPLHRMTFRGVAGPRL